MTILDRLQRLARAELSSLRRSSEAADDVRHAVRDAKRAAADLRTEQRKLHRDIQSLLDASQRWEDRAVLALRRQDETLAHDALTKKQQVDEQLEERRAAFDRVSMQLADMRSSLEALHLRVQAGSDRRDAEPPTYGESGSAYGRGDYPQDRYAGGAYDAASPSPTVPEDLPSLDADLAHFREMEARIEENASWSQADDELDLDGSAATAALNERFRTLEAGASLDALKSQASDAPPRSTPAADTSHSAPPTRGSAESSARRERQGNEPPAAVPGASDDDALAKLRARMNRG